MIVSIPSCLVAAVMLWVCQEPARGGTEAALREQFEVGGALRWAWCPECMAIQSCKLLPAVMSAQPPVCMPVLHTWLLPCAETLPLLRAAPTAGALAV